MSPSLAEANSTGSIGQAICIRTELAPTCVVVFRAHVLITLAVTALCPAFASAAPCPPSGANLTTIVQPLDGEPESQVTVSGALLEPSCEPTGQAESYSQQISCSDSAECAALHSNLAPGVWVHRIVGTQGSAIGQIQARRRLLLDATAGTHDISWPLFRSIARITNTDDSAECENCLRRALEATETSDKPMLIAFEATTKGDIVLFDGLPELVANNVTLDAVDFDGVPHRRTIDVNGLARAALRITGSNNHILGLRVTNVGGGSDMVLIDGPLANGNRIESVEIVGRALEVCERLGETGCVVRRQCVVPTRGSPRGDCGDDGIAVRDDAGIGDPNLLIDVDVSGAFDKGIKISEGGVAIIETSLIHDNSDGGVQSTLGGDATIRESVSEANRGTAGANGIAVNGPRVDTTIAATLETRGNLVRDNALRGISVRSLSRATLRDDFVCGNGSKENDAGFGIALLDAAGFSAFASVRGVAFVHNFDGGVLASGGSTGDFGDNQSPGSNAFAANGTSSSLEGAKNFRNLSTTLIPAIGNHWQGCGPTYACDTANVSSTDVLSTPNGVLTEPANPNALIRAPTIDAISPTFARAGDLVRIYGSGFDAVGFANQPGSSCSGLGRACTPGDPNCVFFNRQPAEIVAATPTMLVVRAPFTCVEPVKVAARTRRSRGYARSIFCTVPSP